MGGTTPQRRSEIIFSIIAMVLGATIFGFIVGNVSAMVGKIDVGAARLREQMTMIKDYMREQELPREMRMEVETFFEYYFSRKLKEVSRMINSGKPVINMGIGSPDIEPNPSVVKALSSAMSHPRAHMYQSYQGLPELRKTISSFYKKYYDVKLNPDSEVLPLMGSKEGIMHLSMAFLNSGDEVLIPNPGYPTYSSVAGLMEAKTIFYDLNPSKNWQPDFEFLDNLF